MNPETRINIIKYAAYIAAFHIIVVCLFMSVPIFCSSPDSPKVFSLTFPMTTVQQMERLNVSALMVGNIIKNGTKIDARQSSRSIYICNDTNIGVVLDQITGMVTNVSSNVCAYDFQRRVDADQKRARIRRRTT